MFKASSDIIKPLLLAMFNKILNIGIYPDQWSLAIISPLHKNGKRNNPTNYRGISLLCTVSKIFTKILNNRLLTWAEENNKLDEGQSAYRKGRSTIDNLFTLNALGQKYLSRKGGRFYCVFVDFSRAFDSIPHAHLWYRLINIGIHGKTLRVLRSMYSKLKSCVKTNSGLTELFECLLGTRQGCMISPLLFILYIDELINMLAACGTPGIFVNDSVSSLHMIMYADDICAVNDTVGRVQSQLNVLEMFCQRYGLKVNMAKTKLMVFRNGGPLKINEKVYFNGDLLESVNGYKYLGLMMSPNLHWNIAIQTLRKQAEKAVLGIKLLGNNCGALPKNIAFQMFDSKVLPILCYGSEIWGTKMRSEIEIVHNQFCKYVLGLGPRSVNVAAIAECGRRPLYIHYIARCIKYWLRLTQMDTARYPKACYNMLLSLDSLGRKTWISDVKYILYSYGFGDVWLNQGCGNTELFVTLFKQRIYDNATQHLHSDINNISKLNTYCQFKYSLESEKYIDTIKWKRHISALARFRCSNHHLAIETQRGKTVREHRLCKFCLNLNIREIEDEFHFLMVCPLYEHIRHCYSIFENIHKNFNYFINIMSTNNPEHIQQLGSFIHIAMKIHTEFNFLNVIP